MASLFLRNGLTSCLRTRQLRFFGDIERQLIPIGRFTEDHSMEEPYQLGQFFLHKQLGYRGVVTASWQAKINHYHGDTEAEPQPLDLNQPSLPLLTLQPGLINSTNLTVQEINCGLESIYEKRVEITEESSPWYQALCHFTDVNSHRYVTCCRSWTQIGPMDAVDYVSHSNMLPYEPAAPIVNHSLFDQLFLDDLDRKEHKYKINFRTDRSVLHKWAASCRQGMEKAAVYSVDDQSIQITVLPMTPSVLGRNSVQSSSPRPFEWCYKVIVQSNYPAPVKLKQRTWIIIDDDGKPEVVTGRGVVGLTPVLSNEQPCFQYLSRVLLPTNKGIMGGFFTFQTHKNHLLHVQCPTFRLDGYDTEDALKVDKEIN